MIEKLTMWTFLLRQKAPRQFHIGGELRSTPLKETNVAQPPLQIKLDMSHPAFHRGYPRLV